MKELSFGSVPRNLRQCRGDSPVNIAASNRLNSRVMRMLLLVSLFVSCAVPAAAQVSLGGYVGYRSDLTDSERRHSFAIIPDVSYSLTDRWSLGTVVGYEAQIGRSQSMHVVLLSPYVEYTWLCIGRVSLFASTGAGWALGGDTGFEVGVSPGIAVALTDRIELDLVVGFLGYRQGYFNGGVRGWCFEFPASELQLGVTLEF